MRHLAVSHFLVQHVYIRARELRIAKHLVVAALLCHLSAALLVVHVILLDYYAIIHYFLRASVRLINKFFKLIICHAGLGENRILEIG